MNSDPGLCKLTDIALKGFLAEKEYGTNIDTEPISIKIAEGKKASKIVVIMLIDLLLHGILFHLILKFGQNQMFIHVQGDTKIFPFLIRIVIIYIDLVNTVERHTICSTRYCLKHEPNKAELVCRFNYPFECTGNTKLKFEPVHTKDKSVKYKASMVTARNDPRINSHLKIQLVGWRANCDVQVILDYHACVEYLCKYAAKGEPRSNTLKSAFCTVVGNLKTNTDPIKIMKKIMIKALGERDFSVQETMHLLLSLKLHSSSFQVLPVNLDGTRS